MPPVPAAAWAGRTDQARREHRPGPPPWVYGEHVARTTLATAPNDVPRGPRGDDRPLPSNRPYVTGGEADLVRDALAQASAAGGGSCGARTEALLEELLGNRTR